MESHRVIPIFPLPLVQFPGAVTPLHIFEPRYRKMLKDAMERDRSFGVIYRNDQVMLESELLPPGSIGCTIEVAVLQELPDGRSNILCVGGQRFSLLRYVEGEPYLQAEVEFFEDDITFDDLSDAAEESKTLFKRLHTALRKMKGESDRDAEQAPELPEDPQTVSFIVAAYLDIEAGDKQELLEMTNTGERLREVNRVLSELAIDYEKRAAAHQLSKKNGHAGRMPKFE